jgi:D-tyrosyl-tRNA(Tyr) deacylase
MIWLTDQRIDLGVYIRLNLKTFPDANTGGQWKASVVDRGGEVLCVSQFTLFAKIVKNKPDFHKAMVGVLHGS